MRALRNFIVSILSAVIIVVLAIFAVQNLQGITTHFIGFTFRPSVWWVSIGSAALGFLLAFLILAPGRIASGWRARTLSREHLRREQELSVLRQEHESLVAQHAHMQAEREGLQTERDQLRARLSAARQAFATSESTTRPANATAAGENYRGADQTYTPSATRSEAAHTDGASGDGIQPMAQPVAQTTAQPEMRTETRTETRTDTAAPVGEGRQLGVGGRLRSMFSRQDEEQVRNSEGMNNDQPPVPTA